MYTLTDKRKANLLAWTSRDTIAQGEIVAPSMPAILGFEDASRLPSAPYSLHEANKFLNNLLPVVSFRPSE
jgi:hypothetical protein